MRKERILNSTAGWLVKRQKQIQIAGSAGQVTVPRFLFGKIGCAAWIGGQFGLLLVAGIGPNGHFVADRRQSALFGGIRIYSPSFAVIRRYWLLKFSAETGQSLTASSKTQF